MSIELNAKELSEEYFDWYKRNSELYNINSSVVRIDLPFLDAFSDELTLYAVGLPSGRIKITDDGWTLNNLSDSGVNINRSETRKRIFNQQLTTYGVSITNNELFIDVDTVHFAEAKHRMLQAVLFINDMFMLVPNTTSNIFLEDVSIFFDTNNIRTTKNASYVGKSGLTHKFEFSIPGIKTIPDRLIKTMAASNNAMFAKSTLADVEQTRPILNENSVFYVFLNDLDKKNNPTSVNPDILTLFEQNDIKPVLYSKRNEVLSELQQWYVIPIRRSYFLPSKKYLFIRTINNLIRTKNNN